jgi:DNA integrity scanning protein DisA with diadenylate cyclase activity
MPDAATMQALLPLLSGPASAVLVLLAVLGGAYRLLVVHILPVVQSAIDRHLKQMDQLLTAQKAEAQSQMRALKALEDAVRALEKRLATGSFSVDA